MQTITISKDISFDNVIDSIDNVEVLKDLKYELIDNNTHIKGVISIQGLVNTILGQKNFHEDVDLDIYTNDEQTLDPKTFKLLIKDYSYVVNGKTLTVYLVLELEGLVTKVKEASSQIIEDINNLNEIKDERKEKEITLVDNQKEEKVSLDVFKFNDSYATFMKIHLD